VPHPDLSHKNALVTGASRGIGEAIARALAAEQLNVAIHFREREADAQRVAASLRECSVKTVAVQADVRRVDDLDRLVETVERELGDIHVLVNNAGITRPQKIEDITEQDWDDLMNVNLKSAFLLSQRVLPKMRAGRWGRIVNVSSVAAQLGGVVGPHYAASKAGLHGLTHGYAIFLAKEGITVNTIAPALIATEMVTSNPRARPDLIPVGRFGLPEEVAAAAIMVIRNGYITGQTINVNGGWYMS
jgi:3-oxoacyl-[acyl-carrier protein] reductase